jgi:hypothetical protein
LFNVTTSLRAELVEAVHFVKQVGGVTTSPTVTTSKHIASNTIPTQQMLLNDKKKVKPSKRSFAIITLEKMKKVQKGGDWIWIAFYYFFLGNNKTIAFGGVGMRKYKMRR